MRRAILVNESTGERIPVYEMRDTRFEVGDLHLDKAVDSFEMPTYVWCDVEQRVLAKVGEEDKSGYWLEASN